MVYGFDASNARFMVSDDGGRNWDERAIPGPMLDLAIHPTNPSRVIASTEQGLVTSTNQGRSWRTLRDGPLALLTWSKPDALYLTDGSGQVALSQNQGSTWKTMGSIGAQPAAFASADSSLHAALP
ncbi:MAG: WD40/YVTN/BNR-like repeat-containing protein, partial [Gammaproteobacteria bacterium]